MNLDNGQIIMTVAEYEAIKTDNEKIKDLSKKVDALEKTPREVTYKTINDKPKLASSLYFLGFVALFCFGFFMHWHWGWLVAIGIFGSSISFSVSEFDC